VDDDTCFASRYASPVLGSIWDVGIEGRPKGVLHRQASSILAESFMTDDPRIEAINWRMPDIIPNQNWQNRALDNLQRQAQEGVERQRTIADASAYQMIAAGISADALMQQIIAFEASLSADEEVMLCVVGGPAGMLIYPQRISHIQPDKLVFMGVDQTGERVCAIQHVTQLSVLLRAVKVSQGDEPRRTGFHHPV
jgi:hypothetical protein